MRRSLFHHTRLLFLENTKLLISRNIHCVERQLMRIVALEIISMVTLNAGEVHCERAAIYKAIGVLAMCCSIVKASQAVADLTSEAHYCSLTRTDWRVGNKRSELVRGREIINPNMCYFIFQYTEVRWEGSDGLLWFPNFAPSRFNWIMMEMCERCWVMISCWWEPEDVTRQISWETIKDRLQNVHN